MTRTHNDPKTRQKDNLSVFNIINNCFNTFELNLQSIRTVAKIDRSSITLLITRLEICLNYDLSKECVGLRY